MSRLNKLASAVLFLLLASAAVAQENPKGEPEKSAPDAKGTAPKAPEGKESGVGERGADGKLTYVPDLHRLRLGFGVGKGSALPAVLSEAGAAWLVNSAVHAGRDPAGSQLAVPIQETKEVPYRSLSVFADYAYRDRFFVSASQYIIDDEFTRQSPTMTTFFAPGTTNLYNSAFEGVRLLQLIERRRTVDFSYLHPLLLRGFKLGGVVGRESYREQNRISYGSFAQTRSTAPVTPSTSFWSQGGDVESIWESSYWTAGLVLRYQLFDWLGFYYRIDPFLKRGGDLTLTGLQLLASGDLAGTQTGAQLLAPVHAATISERGRRHNLEATIRFCCRYMLHVGLLKEDWQRSYDTYLGTTLSNGGFYNAKTPDGIGLGEMSKSFPVNRREIYMKLSVAVFFGKAQGTGKEEKREATPKDFGLEKGALAKLGEPQYLDKMFTGIKSDFEESGIELKEIALGFEAVGLKLERIPGPDGKTKELRVTMDGTIGFEIGSSRLTKIAAELVGKIGKAMAAYPETKAKLGGHVDWGASREYSLKLSQARSDAAKDALIRVHGIAPERIPESRGWADDRMLIPVRKLEPRNRRVEITIITD